MNHRVYRLPPCPSYDVEGMESWLSDQAEKGLFLCRDGFFAGIAAFDRTEPRSVRFRLEPASKAIGLFAEGGTEPDPEAKDLNEYYVWNYLASWGQFFIYFTDRQDARELNTDPAVQALALNLVRRRERGSFLSSVFWLLVYPLLRHPANHAFHGKLAVFMDHPAGSVGAFFFRRFCFLPSEAA